MPQYLRAYCQRADGKAGEPMRFIAATENIGRDKLIIDAGAWQLEHFRNNPVVLWAHDYGGWAGSPRPPIGRATVNVEDRQLIAEIVFDQGDEFARDIERKYRDGFLNAVSVGWDTLEMERTENPDIRGRVTKADLLDISAVPVPGDPGALKERQKRALADYGRDLLKLIDDAADPADPPAGSPPEGATWDETAAAMARLFRPGSQRPEDEREADYRRLCRAYGKHRRTPPEFRSAAELEAMDGEIIRGLFLEGEPELLPDLFAGLDQRAGAALSARNREDLESALSVIQQLLGHSKPAETDDDNDERAAVAAAQQILAALDAATSRST